MVTVGMLVNRTKVLEELAGSEVENICGDLCGFNPSASCAAAGKEPSARKFRADVNTSVLVASVEVS